MIRGTVIGSIWATRKVPALVRRKLLLVAAADSDRLLVCADVLDARAGETVLVSVGSGARNVLLPGPHNRDLAIDAAISQIVDASEVL